jgi:Fur family peroxide stress response transcriptional regulator
MENLVQRLRLHGIAVTPQRLAVLASLQERHDHPSAEKIYREVRRQLPAISFNTVYKTLEILCQKGLIIKVNPLHEVARYDGVTVRHVHLACRRCQTIVDLYWPQGGAQPADFVKEELQGFRVEHQSVTLWGLCLRCQEESDQEP